MLQDLNQISDGKIYSSNDMVRAACHDCEGCHACCVEMGDSVVLDPYDVWRLEKGLGKSFEELLTFALELHVAEGLILPNVRMAGEEERCVFLNEEGRCSIHPHRPGLCRVFPLGRIYEDEGVRYFLQANACQKTDRTKVKVDRWLDTPQLKKYEGFLVRWHAFRRALEQQLAKMQDEGEVKTLNMFVLNQFFVKAYDTERDFYEQFEERMKAAERLGICG